MVVAFYKNYHRRRLKSRGVVMVIHDGFISQPSKTLQYTNDKTLEWLGCCEWPELVQTLGVKSGIHPKPNSNPNLQPKTVVVIVLEPMTQS